MSNNVLITGIERSGSTIIAKILEMAGCFIGETNARKENLSIKEFMDKYYLKHRLDIKGQYPMPDIDEIRLDFSDGVMQLLYEQGYDDSTQWMYKSSRIIQTWKQWHYAFPNAKWIIVRRNSKDIIESCLKTGYMNAFSNPYILEKLGFETEQQGWKWWITYHENRFYQLINHGVNCKVIWPERMLHGDYTQITETLQWLGLNKPDDLILRIDPLFNKRRKNGKSNK